MFSPVISPSSASSRRFPLFVHIHHVNIKTSTSSAKLSPICPTVTSAIAGSIPYTLITSTYGSALPTNMEGWNENVRFATVPSQPRELLIKTTPMPPANSYCVSCEHIFINENSLMQHMRSKTHMGNSIQCPYCKRSFTTASGVTIHVESGTCSSGINRTKINTLVRQLDRNNVITRPMLTMPGYDNVETIATELAWNGYGYQCYLCTKHFQTLHGLNNHLKSPVHQQNIYHCPKSVQQQARSTIQNMMG
ncbi:hypothetical protein V1508DRAFT_285004 [Lipomyces doorenjongii]|uniref:uncharacterized protein n=1 Tax=Lipomyces doorenjongii TaxID=383834 RepID=UPI0034CD3217